MYRPANGQFYASNSIFVVPIFLFLTLTCL